MQRDVITSLFFSVNVFGCVCLDMDRMVRPTELHLFFYSDVCECVTVLLLLSGVNTREYSHFLK